MNILWVIDFDYPTRLHHGGVIRYLNYARELQCRGHRVYFATVLEPKYRQETLRWMEGLEAEGIHSGFLELIFDPDRRSKKLAAWAIHPALSNRILRRFHRATGRMLEPFLEQHSIDVVVLSNRSLLFLADNVSGGRKCLIDYCDCNSLYYVRDIRRLLREGHYGKAVAELRPLIRETLAERYHGRRSTLNLVVSPVDKAALDRLTGRPARSAVLLNGVRLPVAPPDLQKIANRLIFTGNMNFGPNYDAAVWFLSRVFPEVLRRVPEARLVLAGANPPPALRTLAQHSVEITGYVDDLNREIASSSVYVAPLVSGGGFKNKIVEAIANRTYVVATSIAVEFLDPRLRSWIRTADSPGEMVSAIVEYLRHPEDFQSGLDRLYEEVSTAFSWSGRTEELLDLIKNRLHTTTQPATAAVSGKRQA